MSGSRNVLFVLTLCAAAAAACQALPPDAKTVEIRPSEVAAVIEQNVDQLMALDDVVGVGQSRCNDGDCIKVLLARDNTDTRKQLPTEIEGIPVVIEISGSFTANPE
jgi:hypothetical protein